MHGDAAFMGQGSVYETLILAALPGFTTGGTIHVIVNNQLGFTTTPADFRASRYPSDLGKAFDAPIFHVNGDDPEAVVQAARLAVGFRQAFGRRRVHRPRLLSTVRPQRGGRSDLHPAHALPEDQGAALGGGPLPSPARRGRPRRRRAGRGHAEERPGRARSCADLGPRADAAAEGFCLRRRLVGIRLGRR